MVTVAFIGFEPLSLLYVQYYVLLHLTSTKQHKQRTKKNAWLVVSANYMSLWVWNVI